VDSSGTHTFRRDGDTVTSPVLDDGFAKYTPGVSDRRGSSTRFTHPDRMGSVVRHTGSSQGVASAQQYDAWGNVAAASGTWAGPFGYAGNWGYQDDSDSGLKLLGHRYYDASTGRFLTRDPIKDGRNWYAYCENNPLAAVDVTGELTLQIGGGISGITTAGFGVDGGGSVLLGPAGYQFQSSGGAAMGLPGIGASLGLGLDWSGPIDPGTTRSSKIVIAAVIATVALAVDENGSITGVSIGPGVTTPHVGFVHEVTATSELTPYNEFPQPIQKPLDELTSGLEQAIYQQYGVPYPR
jgi:RHS repeat-associated protein